MPRRVAILGSTGSIGVQALDVVSRSNPEELQVVALSAALPAAASDRSRFRTAAQLEALPVPEQPLSTRLLPRVQTAGLLPRIQPVG